MSEVEELEPEVETQEPQTVSIEDLINNVANQDFSKAGPTFAEIMQNKIDAALEQEKIAVARDVFGNEIPEPDEDDEQESDEDDDITDEEIDAAIDETEEDES